LITSSWKIFYFSFSKIFQTKSTKDTFQFF